VVDMQGPTDREIGARGYGWRPPGHDRLVIGHASLGTLDPAVVRHVPNNVPTQKLARALIGHRPIRGWSRLRAVSFS
jgi:hypothetical protein